MVDRTKPRCIPLRTKVNWRTYDAINRRDCIHVDGWLIQSDDDALYFVIELRVGGQNLIRRDTLLATPDGLKPLGDVVIQGVQRRIGGQWDKRHAPYLNALHHNYIRPLLYVRRPGFAGLPSVKLHYVYTDAAISDPLAGLYNMYSATARGTASPAQPAPYMETAKRGRPKSPWNAEQRSLLRTLDKLLK